MRLDERRDRDCGDWRKTCPFIQIVMWQLLYVGKCISANSCAIRSGGGHSADRLP